MTASDAAFHHMLDLPQSLTQDLSFFQSEKACAQENFSEVDTCGHCLPYVLNNVKAAQLWCVTCSSEDL